MLPVFTIIGRPNVGKSTLFNTLTKTRAALVADFPGLTRDRQYGEGHTGNRDYIVVDTGGIAESDNPDMAMMTDEQVDQAMQEGDRLLFVVDAKAGLTTADEEIASILRKRYRDKVTLLVNKVDRDQAESAMAEFHALGLGEPFAISAKQGRGVKVAMQSLLSLYPEPEEPTVNSEDGIRVAIIGRPNVGKSTLVNRMLGEDRVVVFDQPGTTRDSIEIPFDRDDVHYTLVDTAGLRRRSKVHDVIEKFSMIKTIQAIEASHVVMVVLNAQDGVFDQDLRLIHRVVEMGKGLILVINKWDGMDDYAKERFKVNFDKKVNFADFARRYYISALHGSGVGNLYHPITETYDSAMKEITTPELTKVLEAAQKTHQPPLVKGRRIKLRYAHVGDRHPLVIVVHGKQTESLPQSYQRFLSNFIRQYFKLTGVPVVIKLKSDENPYA